MNGRAMAMAVGAVWLTCGGMADAKTVKLLAVGNSFSNNALRYFTNIVTAAGDEAVVAHAMIGGCDFDRHVRHADAYEKDSGDPDGHPYPGKKSLQELLKQDQWEYVTIQQVSHKAPKPETFQPGADRLIAYIRKYAPQAEIVVHETWAYRDDYPTGGTKGFVSTDDMYGKVRASYDAFCKEKGLRMIPSGDAMEAARRDPAWGRFQPDPGFDPKTAVYPRLPAEKRALHNGYSWRKEPKTEAYKLGADKFHANVQGEYLLGCVWYEFFYGRSVQGNSFVPKGVAADDAAVLQRVAHRVVGEKQRPE
jgi:hypothetical protein